jgi:hypothetical protein
MSLTLDAVDDAFFHGRALSKSDKEETAQWIAGRYGLPFSYAGMFAPCPMDYGAGIRVYTGERVSSGESIGHILGEEACRALVLLDVRAKNVREVLKKATQGMMGRLLLPSGKPDMRHWGMYCCGVCSGAYWRHLAVGGLQDSEARLAAAIEVLREHRKGDGQWTRFPFYYTLLALSEMKLPAAAEEMRYTAHVLERYVKRHPVDDLYERRRHALAERVLGIVNSC